MSPLRKSFAVFMAAFWLLATQHCGLEAADILTPQCHQDDGSEGCSGAAHATDGCQIVEGGDYKVSSGTTKVPALQLIACVCLVGTDSAELWLDRIVELSSRDYFEHPRDWVPAWQFERRAAALAHAPDPLIA